jgi:thymidylate synthase ThyX
MDEFTTEEQEIIKPFFTNLDKPVFCLINLPEVVKGALFSRYSRSTKSLRRVLLDEFISKPEMGFKEIVGFQSAQNVPQLVAIKKAEEFYDRVLVGFGDDSVAELGGANIACENVSQIATKTLEDARIGISPLEKSTRYVWFDEKTDGKYKYFRDSNIMQSKFADDYVEVNDLLFDTYSKLINPMMKFVTERFSQEEGVSDRAYNAAVRAQACDVLRAFLPASTLTNVGLFGNGRAFEYLLLKMFSSPLKELQILGASMHEELQKVIPSFVKRANDEMFGKVQQKYLSETRSAMDKISSEFTQKIPIENLEPVTLVEFDPDAEIKIVASMMYPFTHHSMKQLQDLVRKMTSDQRKKIIHEYLYRRANRRHKPGRAFENAYYKFDVLGNFGIYRDLHRHRVLTQERQDFTVKHGFETPKELVEAGFEKDYIDCMKKVIEVFELIYKEFPKQAQYVVAMGFKTRWYMLMNLREVAHLVELRSVQQGHPAYRKIAQSIFLKVKEVHPALAEYLKFVDMNDYSLTRIEAEKGIDQRMEEIKKKYGS